VSPARDSDAPHTFNSCVMEIEKILNIWCFLPLVLWGFFPLPLSFVTQHVLWYIYLCVFSPQENEADFLIPSFSSAELVIGRKCENISN